LRTASLPIGNGVTLDINESSAHDGTAISFINAYTDRGGAIRTMPGCAEYLDTGAGNSSVWSYYSANLGILVIVSGGRIFTQSSQGVPLVEVVGASIAADYPPTFAEDANNVFVAANSKIHSISGAVAIVLGANSPRNVTSLVFIGGYLMAKGDEATGGVAGDTHYSDDKANGYASWEVYNNESRPDALMSLVVAYEQIYNIGRTSLEVSYIDGTVPFSVNKNAAQHFGTMAAHSVAFDGENIYYISEVASSRKIIQLSGGGSPQVISFPIDVPIESFERVDDAQGFIVAWRGQNGYAVTFPTANATVDEQFWSSITLFYHIQSKAWFILGKWNPEEAAYGPYRGVSFTYVEPWGLRLIGGRDGKLYKLQDTEGEEYEEAPVFLHRWRDDGAKEWKIARNVSLGLPGQYVQHPAIRQCGTYRDRQHQFIFSDMTDAGEIFRAAVKTGHISHKSPAKKVSVMYRYNIQCGKPEFVLNGVVETYNVAGS
jgi:hypothetical protein